MSGTGGPKPRKRSRVSNASSSTVPVRSNKSSPVKKSLNVKTTKTGALKSQRRRSDINEDHKEPSTLKVGLSKENDVSAKKKASSSESVSPVPPKSGKKSPIARKRLSSLSKRRKSESDKLASTLNASSEKTGIALVKSDPASSGMVVTPTFPKAVKKLNAATESVTVHECSFLKPHVAGFTAVATTKCSQYIALAKSDCNLELMERKGGHWLSVSVVYATSGQADLSISTLEFTSCGRYLFAARLDGSLTIYRMSSEGLLQHVILQPGGGAIWDVAFAPGCDASSFRLAVASDDGCVRFVSPDASYVGSASDNPLPSDGTHYIIESSETTSARVLSVDWASIPRDDDMEDDDVSDFVVCGDSEGGVRWIDTNTRRTIGRGQIAAVRKVAVLIWTVRFVGNPGVVVCGDDRGLVTVWSCVTHTMESEVVIEGIKGAIWCSAVLRSAKQTEDMVVLGGANGSVGALRVPHGTESTISHLRASLLHTHDVRGIAGISNGRFVSAGLDAQICVLCPEALLEKKVPVERVVLLDGVISQPVVQVIRSLGLVISRGSRDVELWHIPKNVEEVPVKLLSMALKSVKCDLRAVALSENGRHLAISTADGFKFYQIWDGDGVLGEPCSFGKVGLLEVGDRVEGILYGCVDVGFCGDCVVAIGRCRTKVVVYDFKQGRVEQFTLSDLGCEAKMLQKMACGGGRVVVSDSKGSAFECLVWKDSCAISGELKWCCAWSAANDGSKITAMTVSQTGNRLAVGRENLKLAVIDVTEKGFKEHPCTLKFSSFLNSLCFSENEKTLLVSGQKTVNVASASSVRKRKRETGSSRMVWSFHKLWTGADLWSSAVLGIGRIAVLRRRLSVIESYLPDSIPKKRFGG